MSLDREIRANEAAALLANPVLTAVFDEIEAECIATWVATGFQGQADRERVWTMMKAVQKIRGSLGALVADGKIVARQLAQDPMR